MPLTAQQWLQRIRELELPGRLRVMNVCGGHERVISQAGLRAALPEAIELIPGPGCPVCICPEEDIHTAIQLALHEDVTLLAFGDMLRVPVNVAKGEIRSLQQARAAGAEVRPIASPSEAIALAQQQPQRRLVFFAAGFETTMAPVAAMVAAGLPANLSLLVAGRLTWPAVAMLLDSQPHAIDALIAPGHVATVMGAEQWRFVVERHAIPTAIAGFDSTSLLAALYSVLRQQLEGRPMLDNCYPQLVRADGNRYARQVLDAVMDVSPADWRGIGVIPASGYTLKAAYAAHDARLLYPAYQEPSRRRAGAMPPGCDCAAVVLGRLNPNQCRLYGKACTPNDPIGPCMVSDEGACRIWWSSGIRDNRAQPGKAIAS